MEQAKNKVMLEGVYEMNKETGGEEERGKKVIEFIKERGNQRYERMGVNEIQERGIREEKRRREEEKERKREGKGK